MTERSPNHPMRPTTDAQSISAMSVSDSIFTRVSHSPGDRAFLGLLLCCVLMAAAGIWWNIEKQAAIAQPGGARKVDLKQVRKQISDGELSPKKALFYKKVSP